MFNQTDLISNKHVKNVKFGHLSTKTDKKKIKFGLFSAMEHNLYTIFKASTPQLQKSASFFQKFNI